MRQTGILAAAGIYALENNIQRLAVDHEHASHFAQAISENNKYIILPAGLPQTNIVNFSLSNLNIAELFIEHCKKHHIRFSQTAPTTFRAVFHLDIFKKELLKAVDVIKAFKN